MFIPQLKLTETMEAINEDMTMEAMKEERTERKRRLMNMVMERELFRYCGAAALLWQYSCCKKWNSKLEDPRHYFYMPCPSERRRNRFSDRQIRKLREYASDAMESPNKMEGNENIDKIMDLVPEMVGEHIALLGREFQQWVHNDQRRFLKYRLEGECWAVEGLVALKEFLNERRLARRRRV